MKARRSLYLLFAAVLSCAALQGTAAQSTSRDQLRFIVQQVCLTHWRLMHDPAPCLHLTEDGSDGQGFAVLADRNEEIFQIAEKMPGQLTASIHAAEKDYPQAMELLDLLTQKAGRILMNGFPTGVEVSHAMVHGGPFPATTDSRATSVGTTSIYRFTRPVCFQNFPAFFDLKTGR